MSPNTPFKHEASTLRRYMSDHGSVVAVSGKHRGIASVDFDWLEEPNACYDCQPNPYPETIDGEMMLTWSCEVCGGGQAKLTEDPS